MDENSKTEEKLKQTFCLKLLKFVNKILLQYNINVPISIIKNKESEARSYATLRIYSVKQMSL